MKRYIFSFLLCFAVAESYSQDMATLFTNIPDQYLPQLETEWRKDLVDLYRSGKEARLQNTMAGYSTLRALTSDYLFLEKTERSTMEIKLLPLVNNTHVICVVSTVCAPVADSKVEFFTTDWKPLDTAELFTPADSGWFIKKEEGQRPGAFPDALSRLDIELIKYQLSEKDLTLTATYTTPLYLDSETREKIAPFLKDSPRIYTWEKYRFN